MKNLFYLFLLSPMVLFAQTSSDYLVFQIATLNVSPANSSQVEASMAEHNKKFHAAGPHGARVYTVETGPNSGAYKWVMGPAPWSAFDTRPSDDMHNLDWKSNVSLQLEEGGNNEYTRLDPALSRFQKDFTINKLFVRYYDIERGKIEEAKEILKNINKVFAEKIPDETYGVYFNEIPSTSSGKDITIISFFDKYAWMAIDNDFNTKYEEVFGKGSAKPMWEQWFAITKGYECEIWEFHEDLSGIDGSIKAAERQ